MRHIYRILLALRMALWGHRRQKDKAGQPYYRHLLVVAWLAYGLTRDPEAVVVGLLHDYLEDVRPDDVPKLRARFGDMTAARLICLTRHHAEDYDLYISRIYDCGGVVLAVKIADLLHNTDPTRRGTRSRAGRYQRAIQLLTRRRSGLGVTPP